MKSKHNAVEANDCAKYEAEILKTGFPLEYETARMLREAGWSYISNKFYIDDLEENVREIDIVAYKVTHTSNFDVYTVLVVSCKKNDMNAWAVLSRNLDRASPNNNLTPVHAWTNDRALKYMMQPIAKWEKVYHDRVRGLGVKEVLSEPTSDIFAFQEMRKSSGAPDNDKQIFSSITSLMKAQAYEIDSLGVRKTTPCVYQFNLVSVIDTDLVKLNFSDQGIKASSVEYEHYIARYIIKKREIFSRIIFSRVGAFPALLEDYGRLHAANTKMLSETCSSFYDGVLKDYYRRKVFLKDFINAAGWELRWEVRIGMGHEIDVEKITLSFNESDDCAIVGVDAPDAAVDILNKSDRAKKQVKEVLLKLYRYDGPFRFEVDDIPF
ncbi:hypothetical protein C0Z18_09725 [Trinickia dabaoshanensis]|uniref:Uncharacterized protein n=1 Tax=Trinickia dabaoshanensis TaxID=564714 RepID=A0A2N7VUL4_9BURK|nr:hypothetical protein [Trinickia dabaoshanensis]PMS20809.1 hypothetical protein C0Z18_09725 [Trinickia dabaoshanensis]